MTENATFARLFAAATPIAFNEGWKNGTGYFDDAAEGELAPVLGAGELASFVDNYGRKAVVIGAIYGNAVVFERYRDGAKGVLVQNCAREVERNIPNGIDFTSQITDAILSKFTDWVASHLSVKHDFDAARRIEVLAPWAVIA